MITDRDHTAVGIILLLVLFFVIKISSVEIQPWDEGLYAVRGENIVATGEWFDQTSFSLGGLYSSTPPPMAAWGVAVGTTIFGGTPLGVRFFSLLCCAVSLWLLYSTVKRAVHTTAALASIVALGTSLHWVVYSRQAMTEVPLMMFVLGCLYLASKAYTSNNVTQSWKWIGGFALFFAGALLSKLLVSLLPLLFLWPLLQKKQTRKSALLALGVALAIALPWYVYMAASYGSDWLMALSIPHVFESVEGNSRVLGVFYYLNQLVTAQPLVVIAFLYVAVALLFRKFLPTSEQTLLRVVGLWFVTAVLVFSVSATKNPHYVVMMLPAAILLAALVFDKIVTDAPTRVVVFMYAVVLIACAWCLTLPRRHTLNMSLTSFPVLIVAVIGLVLLSAPWIMNIAAAQLIVVRSYRFVVIAALTSTLLVSSIVVLNGRPEEIVGGRAVALAMQEGNDLTNSFVYLYHKQNAGDAMNPQLAWYTNGWMNGIREGHSYMPLFMPSSDYDGATVVAAASSSSPWLVYYHPGIRKDVIESVRDGVDFAYKVHLQEPHYTLFRRAF